MMLRSWKNMALGLMLTFAATSLLPGQVGFAQSQEGEPVEVEEIVIGDQVQDPERKIKVTTQIQDGQKGARIQVKGDKIIVIGKDGKKQEIDISEASSVQVQQSVQATEKNGDRQSIVRGKAIIIGPDGEKKVIELDGPVDGGMLMVDDGEIDALLKSKGLNFDGRFMKGPFQATVGKSGKYMIGVNCEPASDALRAHLQLDDGAGLVVLSVVEGTPAKKAGVQEHDILMYAGDTALKDNQALVDAVQTAAKNDGEVTLVAIRKGDELTLKVKPVERKMGDALGGTFQFQFDKMGPGIIIPDQSDGTRPRINIPEMNLPKVNFPEGFGEEFRAMREEMSRIRKELKELRNRQREDK